MVKGERLVVKVGSNVLTTDRGKLDITRVSALVDQIVWLREKGFDVVLVSSGAVACGRSELRVDHSLDSVEQRQLFSAMGQVKLMGLYYDLFREYGIHIGQVLTTKENFQSERSYQNQRACMEVMLENGVLPVVNENDTVSIEELMFTDNDELSGLIAKMVGAEMLVLLTGVDGLYDGNPSEPGSKVIQEQCGQGRHDIEVPDSHVGGRSRHTRRHCQRQPRRHPACPHREPVGNHLHRVQPFLREKRTVNSE